MNNISRLNEKIEELNEDLLRTGLIANRRMELEEEITSKEKQKTQFYKICRNIATKWALNE